jgi:hypothetical protein
LVDKNGVPIMGGSVKSQEDADYLVRTGQAGWAQAQSPTNTMPGSGAYENPEGVGSFAQGMINQAQDAAAFNPDQSQLQNQRGNVGDMRSNFARRLDDYQQRGWGGAETIAEQAGRRQQQQMLADMAAAGISGGQGFDPNAISAYAKQGGAARADLAGQTSIASAKEREDARKYYLESTGQQQSRDQAMFGQEMNALTGLSNIESQRQNAMGNYAGMGMQDKQFGKTLQGQAIRDKFQQAQADRGEAHAQEAENWNKASNITGYIGQGAKLVSDGVAVASQPTAPSGGVGKSSAKLSAAPQGQEAGDDYGSYRQEQMAPADYFGEGPQSAPITIPETVSNPNPDLGFADALSRNRQAQTAAAAYAPGDLDYARALARRRG